MKSILTLLTALTLTGCTTHRLMVKKEPAIYWQGVAVIGVSAILLMKLKFKEQ